MRALLLAILLPSAALSDGIVRVPYGELEGELAELVDFESFDRYLSPGTKLDGVQDFGRLGAAERFFGQYVEEADGFDRLDGLPVGPLRLMAGKPGENLAVTFYFMLTNHLVGHAAPGYPEQRAGGEGSIAILFDVDQRALGFRVAAEPRPETPNVPKGMMEVSFYGRDGRRIDRLSVPLDWGRQGYGFRRPGGVADIAGITIENRDPAGIAIDDVIFDEDIPAS